MRIAMFQMQNEGSVEKNLDKSIAAMARASGNHADLILFPEVQLTEFFPQYPGQDVRKYQVSADAKIVRAFCAAARDYHIMAVPNLLLKQKVAQPFDKDGSGAGAAGSGTCHAAEADDGRAYDASLLIDRQGRITGIQKMVHVAQAPQFYEQDYYIPADDGFHVFDTEFGKIGIVVCFDRHYPESIRTEALLGADLILIPTVNTSAEPSEMFCWELRVQAFWNSVAIAMCNRVGTEGEMRFSGESIVVDANGGQVLLADDTEQILYADIDLAQSGKIRQQRPYTTLRRPELYV